MVRLNVTLCDCQSGQSRYDCREDAAGFGPCWALRCMALTGEPLEAPRLLTYRWAVQQQTCSACFPCAGLPRQKAARPHAPYGPPAKTCNMMPFRIADSKGHLYDGTPDACEGCRSLCLVPLCQRPTQTIIQAWHGRANRGARSAV